MGIIRAICLSAQKGTPKQPVEQALLIKDHGLEQDAHAGNWHRQVSLLEYEKIESFKQEGAPVADGAFGENLIIGGVDLHQPIGTQFRSGEVVLELTQIGKECHHGCSIFQAMGKCIMPTEGVFAKVLAGGVLKVGDEFLIVE